MGAFAQWELWLAMNIKRQLFQQSFYINVEVLLQKLCLTWLPVFLWLAGSASWNCHFALMPTSLHHYPKGFQKNWVPPISTVLAVGSFLCKNKTTLPRVFLFHCLNQFELGTWPIQKFFKNWQYFLKPADSCLPRRLAHPKPEWLILGFISKLALRISSPGIKCLPFWIRHRSKGHFSSW